LTHFQYISYSQNLGHSASYNDGLKWAKGKYTYYMGSNITLLNTFIAQVNTIINNNNDCDIISFTNQSSKSLPVSTVFNKITDKSHEIAKRSLSDKIFSVSFLKNHNIHLNSDHYYPLIYFYSILSHFHKWLSLNIKLVDFHENKSYSYNLADIFTMNEILINEYSKTKFWIENREFLEYLMIIYVLKIFIFRACKIYSDRKTITNILKKSDNWLKQYIPNWRKNKIFLKCEPQLSNFKFIYIFVKYVYLKGKYAK
jgi:glycosyltransferase involved in cell wall biosynthesis